MDVTSKRRPAGESRADPKIIDSATAAPGGLAIALAGPAGDELQMLLSRQAEAAGLSLDCVSMPQSSVGDLAKLESMLSCTAALAAVEPTGEIGENIFRFFLLAAQFGIKRAVMAVLPDGDAALDEPEVAALFDEIAAFGAELDFDALDVIALARDEAGELCNPRWYKGPPLTDLLMATGDMQPAADQPLRIFADATDGAARDLIEGRLAAGVAQVEDKIVALPAASEAEVIAASPLGGDRLQLRLDRPVRIEPGALVVATKGRPEVADQMAAHIIWFGAGPLLPGRRYDASMGNQRATVQISALKHKINAETLEHVAAGRLANGEIGYCNLSLDQPIVFDAFDTCRETGRVTISDRQSGRPVGMALISHALRRATNIHWQALAVDRSARAALKGQVPCCLWFTGLSGSGKSTVASLLEKRLQSIGRHTYTLDGDNVRHGLNRDLGFTDVDRVENMRRVAEVSKLFVDAGLIVLCSFISPFRDERRLARDLFAPGEFLEVFIDTPLEVCEQRDVKGLYKKARAGELKNFTGIDSPFEPPENAELNLKGGAEHPEALVEVVFAELKRRAMV